MPWFDQHHGWPPSFENYVKAGLVSPGKGCWVFMESHKPNVTCGCNECLKWAFDQLAQNPKLLFAVVQVAIAVANCPWKERKAIACGLLLAEPPE